MILNKGIRLSGIDFSIKQCESGWNDKRNAKYIEKCSLFDAFILFIGTNSFLFHQFFSLCFYFKYLSNYRYGMIAKHKGKLHILTLNHKIPAGCLTVRLVWSFLARRGLKQEIILDNIFPEYFILQSRSCESQKWHKNMDENKPSSCRTTLTRLPSVT